MAGVSPASTGGTRARRLERVLPAELGERARAPAGIERLLARGRAVERALHDALQDRGDAKQVVRQIEIPMPDLLAPGARAVCRNVLVFARDAERAQVQAGDAAEAPRGDVPAHAVVGEVGQRVAER